MNSLMTKIYGQRILDGDLLFDHKKITFYTNPKAALLSTIAMALVTISSAFNIYDTTGESSISIASVIIGGIAILLGTLSVIKYLAARKINLIEFAPQDIKEVAIREMADSLRISIHLNDNTTHKISCAKDRYSGKLVQTLKDADVNLIYL
ncbi:hypothetical protein BXY64_2276 [Marinifilum flexuosum]|uniref:Uncharacterized protein n=2 Tax=Marinifilum flexuosum TaxID=1117708 RepID=A0A419X3B8_9BACT|nr:hypothetical protein BXY64_2276 [Marinifilum flexuosum]